MARSMPESRDSSLERVELMESSSERIRTRPRTKLDHHGATASRGDEMAESPTTLSMLSSVSASCAVGLFQARL